MESDQSLWLKSLETPGTQVPISSRKNCTRWSKLGMVNVTPGLCAENLRTAA
jgi:hypothetical protein